MLRQSSATPCPMPTRQHKRESISSFAGDDTTANIDFTSAIPKLGAGLRNAKPRRPGKSNVVDFAIHEDDAHLSGRNGGDLMKAARRNMVTRPPQRLNRSVVFASSTSAASISNGAPVQPSDHASRPPSGSSTTSRRLSQAPKRPTVKHDQPAIHILSPLPEDTVALPNMTMDGTTILKPARRGTIYIPSEDTTMPSMYMDLFSPIKNLNPSSKGASSPEEVLAASNELTGIAAQMIAKKQKPTARKSLIAMSPKRGPLQVTLRPVQENTIVEDRWGQGGGKENVPPGVEEVVEKMEKSHRRVSMIATEPARRYAQPGKVKAMNASKLYEPTASSSARVNYKQASQRASTKSGWNAGPSLKTSRPVSVRDEFSLSEPPIGKLIEQEAVATRNPVPSRFVLPKVDVQPPTEFYPLLPEDLANPSMYEENWLSHQEIAITQLINNLFSASNSTQSILDEGMLRIRLLEKYNSSDISVLCKRLQASLLYGALSVPAETLKGASRLSTDLARRRAFIDFWLDTYDLSSLRSTLEVVVGRQITAASRSSSSSRTSTENNEAGLRRALQRFIETFFIRNEDGMPEEPAIDREAWSYQRTLLRGLMLIKLLDGMKASAKPLLSTCVFQQSSTYKSSSDVVKALFQMLNPSAGDPIRALNHLGYSVSHAQHPLEEYAYQMDSLAVDLRDGVRLTRLVELLLYPSASKALEHAHDTDATTTVLLPTGEILSLTGGERNWPLSQHLKFPALGRATKLYNVQIALSALQAVKGMAAVLKDIKAEDIVDGYREKTVKLLWGLTSKWGLGGLIDWADVEREIKSLCRRANSYQDNDFFDMDGDEEGYARHKILLKSWAQAIASKNGIVVRNLTTSFADGKVFEAIVDEYSRYLPSATNITSTKATLSTRLTNLGCSSQFAQLFTSTSNSPNHTHLFDRDFVLAALAFLCSRLLGPTKAVRAAVTIQGAWRKYWARVILARKMHLKARAEDCAEVLRSRQAEAVLERCDQDIVSPAMTEGEDVWLSL